LYDLTRKNSNLTILYLTEEWAGKVEYVQEGCVGELPETADAGQWQRLQMPGHSQMTLNQPLPTAEWFHWASSLKNLS